MPAAHGQWIPLIDDAVNVHVHCAQGGGGFVGGADEGLVEEAWMTAIS